MTFETLTVSVDARGVARLVLNRPEVRNALSDGMIADLSRAAAELGQDPSVRAVVLSGAGPVFCAGADLGWMRSQVAADRPGRMAEARKLAAMLKALNEMPKPLVGRLHGGAYGGGVGLASVCDVAVAAQDTRFGLTETRLGLVPATIGPYVIARIGEGMARRVFMSSRIFDAAEARELGLVARAVPETALDAAVEAEVAPYLLASPEAVAAAKSLARELGPRIDAAVIEATVTRLADTWETEAARHGIEAFLARTKPRWT